MKPNKSIYIQNHRFKEKDVQPHEFYSTHPNSVETFLNYGFRGHYLDKKDVLIWEPACGKGNISRTLVKNGFNVISSDLIDRYTHLTDIGQIYEPASFFDFETIDPNVTCIMTNPPFSMAEDFIRHAYEIGNPDMWIIMYLKLTFLEGKRRYLLFKDLPLEYVYVHSSRQGCSPGGATDFGNGGAVAYAWFMWRKEGSWTTELKWLPPN